MLTGPPAKRQKEPLMTQTETEGPPGEMTWGETVLVWLWAIVAVLATINTVTFMWRDDVGLADYVLRFATTGLAYIAAWANYTWTRFRVGSKTSAMFYQWAYLTGAFALNARLEGGGTFYAIISIFSGIMMLVYLIVWVSDDDTEG
jgi:hypothetical protein